MNDKKQQQLAKIAKKKGYASKRHHIFLCTDDKCAQQSVNLELWKYLKKRLKEIEPDSEKALCARSKSGCLRICCHGPLALVYPEGTLYGDLDRDKIDRIIDQHLLAGKPVDDLAFFGKPLTKDEQ